MPAAEAEALRMAYVEAEVILEYGTGGSTVMAGDMPGKTVFAVESSAEWAQKMRRWFRLNPAQAEVHLHHADVGPTADWGTPTDVATFRRWPGYALGVWDREDFRHPDVVLIDGRFRVGCLLTTAFRISRPVQVLFDDYVPRKVYHAVEDFLAPSGRIGRMARFDLTPQPLPMNRWSWYMKFLTRPV